MLIGEPEYMPNKIHMGPAKCALDLGDGSERGEYVNQDYILNVLGRPHRAVNIMYTYYPKDEQWPQRISEACADMEVNFAWDYPYDDYPPFTPDGAQFEQMRDIRRHGQDVMLTLTIDCSLDDNECDGEDCQSGVHQREHVTDLSLYDARDEQSCDDDNSCSHQGIEAAANLDELVTSVAAATELVKHRVDHCVEQTHAETCDEGTDKIDEETLKNA